MKEKTVLYISYTGLLEALGQSQILNYLLPLAEEYNIILLTYEKKSDWENKELKNSIKSKVDKSNIEWYPLRYHKAPSLLATLYDLLVGLILTLWIIVTENIKIIHARSYIPSAIAFLFKNFFGIKFVFDMRGFWIDERVASGKWNKSSKLYKFGKFIELSFLKSSDVIVSLTNSAVKEIESWSQLKSSNLKFKVIPTCTDLEHFSIKEPNKFLLEELKLKDRFVIGYVGSVGGWNLFEKVLDCFKVIKELKYNSCLVILNQGQHDYIKEKLKENKISEDDFRLLEVEFEKVPKYINSFDLGIFFNKTGLTRKASAPTRLGEFLSCGVPVISNEGVGDVKKVIEDNDVGKAIAEFNNEEYKEAFKYMLDRLQNKKIEKRCRKTAEDIFALRKGVESYKEIYNNLLN